MEISNRIKSIPPYVFAALDKKRQAAIERGVDVINLGIGDPDQPTPKHVLDAMHKAIDDPANHRYPPFGGMKEYKQAAAEWCHKRFGIDLDPDSELTSVIGTKEGIHHTIMAMVDPGDAAIIPDPAYPVYRTSTILAGGTPHFMHLRPDFDFTPDLEAIPDAVADKAKLLFINYPNNPTAGFADMSFLEKAVAFCKKHEILLCSDLAYSEMTFDGHTAHSIFEVPGSKEIAIEFHSLSKGYNMTGWRVGFACGNKEAVKALAQIKANVDTDIFRAVQIAAIAAFKGPRDHIDACNKLYKERRDLAVNALSALGWPVKPTKATFYMWLPVPKGMTSATFSERMLEEAGIMVPPGTAYGPSGEGYFRLSLCADKNRLQEAFNRMKAHNIVFEPAKATV